MNIESDDEFLALMRERFALKPYTGLMAKAGVRCDEYWTDERYEEMIQGLLKTQQENGRGSPAGGEGDGGVYEPAPSSARSSRLQTRPKRRERMTFPRSGKSAAWLALSQLVVGYLFVSRFPYLAIFFAACAGFNIAIAIFSGPDGAADGRETEGR